MQSPSPSVLSRLVAAFFISITISISIAKARILNVPDDFQTIQAGIDAAEDGDTVLVQSGVYTENVVFDQSGIVVGSFMITTDDPAYIDSTIIDGNSTDCVVSWQIGEEEEATLRGMTIRNGGGQMWGGGIDCQSGNARLEDLVVKENQAAGGAGIYCSSRANLEMRRVVIRDNEAGRGGGNEAGLGGGMAWWGCDILMEDCSVINNTPDNFYLLFEGGLSNVTMRRCLVANHLGRRVGVGIFNYCNLTLENCTITGHSDGLRFRGGNNYVLTVRNSILCGNTGFQLSLGGSCSIAYCDIEGGIDSLLHAEGFQLDWGDGNIDSDPLFLDPDNGDYSLSPDSPCIDAGDPESPLDPDGTRADMGAFYFHQRDIEVDPNELHFRPLEFGGIDSLPVEVTNAGKTDLLLRGAGFPLDNSCFHVAGADTILDTLSLIAPDSTYRLWIYFEPREGGMLRSTLALFSDDPDEEELEITVTGEILAVPSDNLHSSFFALHSAFPNPFNSSTTIRFSTSPINREATSLRVYGIDGRLATDLTPAQNPPSIEGGRGGLQKVIWNAEGLPGGIYFIRLESGQEVRTKKVVLMR